MKREFINFEADLILFRDAIDRETIALMRSPYRKNVDSNIDIEGDDFSINTVVDTFNAVRITMEPVGDTFNVIVVLDTVDDGEMDYPLTDCNTDDMIAVYEYVYNQAK